jgi:hypothetical protein
LLFLSTAQKRGSVPAAPVGVSGNMAGDDSEGELRFYLKNIYIIFSLVLFRA